jgi:phosphatidylserine/phosphatidylglycerophosphate/cardiolipin synthase-like enzyme
MVINTGRLEPDAAIPADLIFAQGSDFNSRLTQEISNEQTRVDIIIYRLEVDNITQALLQKFASGVPVRVIVDPAQYTNNLFPEYWLTHANIDRLFAAGVPILQTNHQGVTHMKTLITSTTRRTRRRTSARTGNATTITSSPRPPSRPRIRHSRINFSRCGPAAISRRW